jgi:hypothetical protein
MIKLLPLVIQEIINDYLCGPKEYWMWKRGPLITDIFNRWRKTMPETYDEYGDRTGILLGPIYNMSTPSYLSNRPHAISYCDHSDILNRPFCKCSPYSILSEIHNGIARSTWSEFIKNNSRIQELYKIVFRKESSYLSKKLQS